MKAPAVAIAAAFVCGIMLGLCPPFAQFSSSPVKLGLCLAASAALGLIALLLLRSEKLLASGAASLLCWLSLGLTGAAIAQEPLPSNHVTELLEHNQLSLKTPLRWHGILRDEPTHLPWGTGYEIELLGVDYEGTSMPISGGLRISFTPHAATDASLLPQLHAGDEIDVVTEARRPPFFRDEGAFDRRAYLVTQNVDLIATLRSPKLLQKTSTNPRQTISNRLARARSRLRDETDTLLASDPRSAATLRAMLLGDRSFVDRDESIAFQKTGVFHILVVAGVHVGALAALIFWTTRKLRFTPTVTIIFVVALLAAYVAIVEVRAPVVRATLMACAVVLGGFFYHGSKNSTMPNFLSAVNPQIAIISSGEGNPYGHPNPEVLHRLENAGVRTLRTDTNGAIHILTDGKQIEVSCFVACPAPASPSINQAQAPVDHQQHEQ